MRVNPNQTIEHIVIVGGGTAGWLTAGILAADHHSRLPGGLKVTLIESPNVTTVGVGEGTWPTMRSTLKKLGISETDFIRQCDASFKQGSRFAGWQNGDPQQYYYHPFVLPQQYGQFNLAPHWQDVRDQVSFADAVCWQSYLCERQLAPKRQTSPEFQIMANYGYHLDAGKFGQLLHQHGVDKLGVNYISDHVTGIESTVDGDIAGLVLQNQGLLSADLFIDCSGSQSLLLGQHYQVPFVSCKDTLFIDRALAVQLPYTDPNGKIASATLSTAQTAGWIWDIGLQSRRGIGHVYSSDHGTEEQALQGLIQYIGHDNFSAKSLAFNPGYRQHFWHKNCVAVGMAAGFIEPLEASALALVELSANMISEQLPQHREVMAIVAQRFNDKFHYRWQRIIDFLKLHYAVSARQDSPFWRDNTASESIPESLQQLLTLWRYQAPWHDDLTQVDEIFPSASYQYVLYGMGFETLPGVNRVKHQQQQPRAQQIFDENIQQLQKLLGVLPSHRALLEHIQQYGLSPI